MKRLNEDIKEGRLKNVYLLYGEEAYLRKQYKERLTRAVLPTGGGENYAYFEGGAATPAKLIELSETLPFFSEKRLIVVEDSALFKKGGEKLAEYLEELPPTTYLIFVEREADKRGKLFKAVKAKGRAVELPRQDEKTLLLWITGLVGREGKRITRRTAACLLHKAGTDMENLASELEKLFCYTLDKEEITQQDIEEICTARLRGRIFDMAEAVALKELEKALGYYYDLLALREPPMRLFYMLTREFRLLLEVKALVREGFGRRQAAERAGIPLFAADRYIRGAGLFSFGKLKAILEEAAFLEEEVKTGRLKDTLSVELFIVKYSGA